MSCHMSIRMCAMVLHVVYWFDKNVHFGLGQSLMKWLSSQLKHFVRGFDLLIWALQSTVSCDFEL